MPRRLPHHLFPVLLGLYALLRGLAVGGALMPFEGWDEYQHLGVAAFVAEEGRMPTRTDRLPASLHGFLRAHPHPDRSARDLATLGVRDYRGRSRRAEGPPPRLYQAQHGPLYYHGAAGLRRLLPPDRPDLWADLLRAAGALMGALAACAWYGALRGLLPGRPAAARLGALLLAASPLASYDQARVANDALAVLLGSVTLLLYARLGRSRYPVLTTVLLGALSAGAVLAKAVGTVLLPLLGVALPIRLGGQRRRWITAALLGGLIAYGALAGPYHLRRLREGSTLTGMAEAEENRAAGRGSAELARALREMDWRRMAGVGLHHTLFVGGWSFVRARRGLELAYRALIYGGLGLLAAGLLRRSSRRRMAVSGWASWEMVGLLALMQLALLYHALESSVMTEMLTNPWYGILSLPALYGLVLTGPESVRSGWGLRAGLLLLAVLLGAYYCGTYLDMPVAQVPGAGPLEALRAIRSHHPVLGPMLPLALVGEALLLPVLLAVLLASAGGEGPAHQRAEGHAEDRIRRHPSGAAGAEAQPVVQEPPQGSQGGSDGSTHGITLPR